jgi:uncharacterized membrane protein
MEHKLRLILKYVFLLMFGGSIYCGIEILYRGYTHWTMYFLGGTCFIVCGLVNEVLSWETPLPIQMLLCGICVTALEFISGVILNLILKLNIWDYSNLPFNVLGQICLPFFFAWCLLGLVAIVLDDWLRYLYFNERRPRYKWF